MLTDPTGPGDCHNLLITGCYRSGTTLVEKVLNQHPGLAVASQPFPVLYALLKERFLAERNLTRRYPLDHLFLESGFTRADFYAFLDRYRVESEDLYELFDRLEKYQGLWTPEIRSARGELRGGTFWDLYDQLQRFLERLFPRPGVVYRGTKEVLIEEYAPYFARHKIPVVCVMRDPRGMIASLNFCERGNFAGANRPVLFSLRAWRKSVAIATELASTGTGWVVRYEDIAVRPTAVLQPLCEWLQVEPVPEDVLSGTLIDQYGRTWHGNSSFSAKEGIQRDSIASWEAKLPRAVVEYIETICMPEMRLLGYGPSIRREFDPEVIRSYRDPFSGIHSSFPPDYSHDRTRVEHEIERVRQLEHELDPEDQRRWFISPRAYLLLKAHWSRKDGWDGWGVVKEPFLTGASFQSEVGSTAKPQVTGESAAQQEFRPPSAFRISSKELSAS